VNPTAGTGNTTYYPPPAFAFSVAVVSGKSTSADPSVDAAFQEVSGIDPKVDVEEVVEGGLNSYVHQLPGVTKHSNLVLKRGYVTRASALAQWAAQSVGSSLGSPIQVQTLNVYLLGGDGQPVVTWTFLNAWPVKWDVGTLDANNSNAVLTQTLELSYATVTTTLNSN
jgi:phage tail-like protein